MSQDALVYIIFHVIGTQDVHPSKRPGAGPDGYASLKKHPFFRGIDWKNLRKTQAPKLALEANVFFVLYVNETRYLISAFLLLKMFPFRQMRMKIARIQIGYHIQEVWRSINRLLIMVLHHLLKYAPIYLN
jgi:hypothetical protein